MSEKQKNKCIFVGQINKYKDEYCIQIEFYSFDNTILKFTKDKLVLN